MVDSDYRRMVITPLSCRLSALAWHFLSPKSDLSVSNHSSRLKVPYRAPAIDDNDFDVPYPEPQLPDLTAAGASQDEDCVHYHIFMAKTAHAYYKFRKALRSELITDQDRIQIVRRANDELAGIIETLPPHLHPDLPFGSGGEKLYRLESSQPWIKWQRFDLTLVLLHLRIRVNRTLQSHWLPRSVPDELAWARTISVKSSLNVIWINTHWDQNPSMRKQWYISIIKDRDFAPIFVNTFRALSYHIFTSAILLLRECQDCNGLQNVEHVQSIRAAITLLDQVSDRNVLANHASIILQARLNHIGIG